MGAKVAMNAAALDTDEHSEVEAGPVRVQAVAVNTPAMYFFKDGSHIWFAYIEKTLNNENYRMRRNP